MKKIGSLLAAIFVFAASFVPMAHATNPCIRTTVTGLVNFSCGLRDFAMTTGVEYDYNNGDSFSAFNNRGCVGNASANAADLKVYVWDVPGQKWVYQGHQYVTMSYGCESLRAILTNWHLQDCSLGFTGYYLAENPYCPCQQQ